MTAFTAGQSSLVGKAPAQAEFLRIPSSAPGFAAFDGWLTEATEWALGRAGPAWQQAFTSGAVHAFVFRPPAAEDLLLCGALAPSRDRAGRLFPLAATASIRVSPTLLSSPHLLPFVLEGFWARATELLLDVTAQSDLDIAAANASLIAEPQSDEAEAAELYGQWTAELELPGLFSLLGPPLSEGDPAGPLRLLAETVAPLAGKERPDTPLSLRVPLGLAGGVALCFWLDVLVRCAGWRATIPSFFWSHDGQRGAAILHFGAPPKMTLAELWMPTGRYDPICDLTAAPPAATLELLPPAAPELLAVLAAPEAKVSDLLGTFRANVVQGS